MENLSNFLLARFKAILETALVFDQYIQDNQAKPPKMFEEIRIRKKAGETVDQVRSELAEMTITAMKNNMVYNDYIKSAELIRELYTCLSAGSEKPELSEKEQAFIDHIMLQPTNAFLVDKGEIKPIDKELFDKAMADKTTIQELQKLYDSPLFA